MCKINFYHIIAQVDDILGSEINAENIKKLFELIENNLPIEDYFFNRVANIKWFYPLKEKGFFLPEKAPGPMRAEEKGSFYIPEWNVLRYLERISQHINAPDNERYIGELLDIIKKVSTLVNAKGERIDNFRTWYYFVKILANIPNEKIPHDVIDLIPLWLESRFETSIQGEAITTQLLPKFLKDQATSDDIKKAEKIISFITDIKTTPLDKEKAELYGKKEEYKFKFDSYWLEKIFDKHIKQIAEKCSIKVVEDLVDKIRIMLKSHEDGAYESFYIGEHIYEPLDLLTKALKNILNEKAKLESKEIKELLSCFINDEFYYFQKTALYIIGQNPDSLQDIVWANLDKVIGDSIKRNYFVGDELKHLLKNLHDLTAEQKKAIKAHVDKGPKKDIPKEEREKYILRWKQKIYQALISDPYFKDLYDELKDKTKEDAELTPGIVWLGMKSGKEESPLSAEDFVKKTNKELAEIFANFRSEDFWKGATVDGLSDSLKEVVQKQPEKFSSDFAPFLRSGYLYIYDILWGLRDAWKEKKSIDWKSILSFIRSYIKQEAFWEDKLKVEGSHWAADYKWVLRLIGELIQEGTKDDTWAFDAALFPEAEEILFSIIDRLLKAHPKEDNEEEHDPVTYALNSYAGNIVTALIYLALRKARLKSVEFEKADERWSSQIREKYEKLLVSHISEAFTQLGQYLPNFWYLDKNWVRAWLTKIVEEEDKYWSNFFVGYLYGAKVYLNFFEMMMPHYERAMDFKFKSKTAEERYIQHIAIGYLSSLIKLQEGSLLCKLLDKTIPDKIDILVRYFRSHFEGYLKAKEEKTQKSVEIDDVQKNVLDIWRYIYEKHKDKSELSDDEKDAVSQMLMLAIFLPKIDEENFQWVVFSLSKMRRYYDGRFLIEDLIILKNRGEQPESGRFVGKILREIVIKITPTTFKENIKKLVIFLYELGDADAKDIADEVCVIYAKKGIYDEVEQLFLRDIYEKYNK
jgi:hypothetical protein